MGGTTPTSSGSSRKRTERTRRPVYCAVSLSRRWSWAALALLVLVAALLRARLLDVPLDRDEGEYAWIGSLLLDGVPPYARAYNMKMPGIYLVYAAGLAAFGHTIWAVHAALMIGNAVAIVLVFLLSRRLFDDTVAVAAAGLFAVATLNPEIHGLASYAEHFVVASALAGALALLVALERRLHGWFALAGLCFGIAFIVKQSGGLLALLAVGMILGAAGRGAPDRRTALSGFVWFVIAALVPLAAVGIWLFVAGTFANFWFWTFRYAVQYATLQSADAAARALVRTAADIVPGAWPVIALAAVGAIALFRSDVSRSAKAFVLLLAGASALAISAGFYYRHQYFLLGLPVGTLLGGLGARTIAGALPGRRARAAVVAGCVAFAGVWQLSWQADIFFRATPAVVSRAIYGRNPFVESVEIARYIRERSSPSDRIAVIGSEPQVYFYARRPPATSFIYMYPLMEAQPFASGMQRALIGEVEAARPAYLVYVNLGASWLRTAASDPTLDRWFHEYVRQYERVGIADIISRELTRYRWDDAARDYSPESPIWMAVYRRRD